MESQPWWHYHQGLPCRQLFKSFPVREALFIQAAVDIILRSSTSTYSPSEIDLWLGKRGLSNAQVISKTLAIVVDHTPFPVGFPIAPRFFTSLKQAGSLVIRECQDCFGLNPNAPPMGQPALIALPGLSKLSKFWNFTSSHEKPSSLVITGTALHKYQDTFSGLRCAPGLIKLSGNKALTGVNGRGAINATTHPTRTGNASHTAHIARSANMAKIGNSFLQESKPEDALKTLAGCLETLLSPLKSVELIQTGISSGEVSRPACRR
jgi:hypothetical protein